MLFVIKHFTKYTLCCRTHLTTLSHLLAVGGVTSWIFGTDVCVYSDHNPLLYLTESVPKSAKLMLWALALQEFSVTFKYRAGRANVAADCLSRLKSNYNESTTM